MPTAKPNPDVEQHNDDCIQQIRQTQPSFNVHRDIQTAHRDVQRAVNAGKRPSRHTVLVTDCVQLDDDVMLLSFQDPYIAHHAKPAQFVNIYSSNPLRLLPRPFGVCRARGDIVDILFAVVGDGTKEFAQLHAGDRIDVLGPLGNSFEYSSDADYVLVGGGLGVPPLIYAAQWLTNQRALQHSSSKDDGASAFAPSLSSLNAASPDASLSSPAQPLVSSYLPLSTSQGSHASSCGQIGQISAWLGYRNKEFANEIIAEHVDQVHSITNLQGTVVDLLNAHESDLNKLTNPVILSCGPMPMMRAVAHWAAEHAMECQLSLESRMACGYGTCVVCVVDTLQGREKVCASGPVFTAEALGWT